MPDASPRVGVAVVNYQGAQQTIECLKSLTQLAEDVRVIVVDNGSGDESVERIGAAAPETEIIANEQNLGFGAGNNVAIKRLVAEGVDFVWLLNNDATVERGTLTAMLAIAAGDERIGAVGSVIYDAVHRDTVQTWGGGSVSTRTGRTSDSLSAADPIDYITAASALVRSEALRDIGCFDPRFFFLYEDVDLGIRLRQRGWDVAVAESSRVWHVGGGTSPALSPLRMEHHAAGLVVLLRKHSPVPLLGSLPMLGYYAWIALHRFDASIIGAAWRGWRRGWRL